MLERCVAEAQCGLAQRKLNARVLTSDNGSTDGSIELADMLGARVVRIATKSYGNGLRAVRCGFGKSWASATSRFP
jgi:hypothetical protein